MKFGVHDVCDIVFKAKSTVKIGSKLYQKGEPVLFIDSAKTSNLEVAATPVYAQGGRANARLIAWEGEKTVTFTLEDALLSPVGFAMLSGAGLVNASTSDKIYIHRFVQTEVKSDKTIQFEIDKNDTLTHSEKYPIFVISTEADGSLQTFYNEAYTSAVGEINTETQKKTVTLTPGASATAAEAGISVFVDYYVERTQNASEFVVKASDFAGNYYVEGLTMWRREDNGVDMPAMLTFPNVKLQSNFTFSMAASGDPSTFTFTMDVLPGVIAGHTDKAIFAVQFIDESAVENEGAVDSVTGATTGA